MISNPHEFEAPLLLEFGRSLSDFRASWSKMDEFLQAAYMPKVKWHFLHAGAILERGRDAQVKSDIYMLQGGPTIMRCVR